MEGPLTRSAVALVALAAVVACTTEPTADPRTTASTTTTSTTTTTASTTTTTTTTPPRDCFPDPGHPGPLSPTDPVGAALAVSRATFPCADHLVVAAVEDAWSGAALASAGREPLLLLDGGPPTASVAAEVARLDPAEVTLVGDRLSRDDLRPMLAGREVRSSAGPRVPPLTPQPGVEPSRLWVVSPAWEAGAALAWAAAAAAGDALVPVDVPDLRMLEGQARDAVTAAGKADPVWVGDFGEDGAWKLDVVRAGAEVPGGGQLLLPGRRLVAFYGNPTTSALGVLGEQGPVETIERMLPIVAAHGADGVPVVPAFEIIATVASASAGEDGDYSAELGVDELRPWVEVAAEQGVYVILDLQPGRTDFLTQAMRYEELLALPHVGLALDPEWRLGPDQVHLRQIGSVDAAEVNRVAEWLAGLVREHRLPQKLLLLHQFKLTMITNRETVATPPELAVVIQMDGQGPLGTKYDTWDALTAGAVDSGWWWGWKNFYDEDSPMATTEQVLALDPVPVYVSFQ